MTYKITQLTAAASVALTDLVEVTVDPSGTPLSRGATLQQNFAAANAVPGGNIFALLSGTTSQAFHVYNTWSSAGANYERLSFDQLSGTYRMMSQVAGTGSHKPMQMNFASYNFASAGGTSWWQINTSGYLIAGAGLPIRMAVVLVSALPAAATAGAGARMFVSDAAAPVFGSAVTGGGAVGVPVYSDGSAWKVG